MTIRHYHLLFNHDQYLAFKKFRESYQPNFIEEISISKIKAVACLPTSNDLAGVFDINNVAVTMFYGTRLFSGCQHQGNLRMIGTNNLIKKTEKEIGSKGFDLKEIK